MDILIPLAGIAMIVAIVLGPSYFRARTREKMLETFRLAYEKGQPVPPELIESLSIEPQAMRTPAERAERDLKAGVIMLCIAFALIVLGWMISEVEDAEAFYVMIGVAAFPGFIGLALIAFGLTGRGRVKG